MKNDRVIGFTQISEPERSWLFPKSKNISSFEGAPPFYCFNNVGSPPIEGTRDQIEGDLIKLLGANSNLNVHSKLIVASFLNLFKTQFDLIQLANDSFNALGISNTIDPKAPFQCNPADDTIDIGQAITSRLQRLKQADDSIDELDVAHIKNNLVFFQKQEAPLEKILNRENALNKEIDQTMGTLLNKTYENDEQSIDINKITENENTFDFVLLSQTFSVAQQIIEAGASSRKVTDSILDIGLKIDNQIFRNQNQLQNTNKATDPVTEKLLKQSIDEISAHFLKREKK